MFNARDKSRLLAAVVLLVGVVPVVGSVDFSNAPDPDGYPAEGQFAGKPATPVLASKLAHEYRTVIRRGAVKGPNFAGHYTVVSWGCGLGSYMLVVVDARTGQIYEPPFGCMTLTDYGIPGAPLDGGNPAFRLESRLLVTVGIEDRESATPDDMAARFYDFEDGKFKLLYTLPFKLDDEEGDH